MIQFFISLNLSWADSRGHYCYCHARKDWPNTRTYTHEGTHTKGKRERQNNTRIGEKTGRGGRRERERGGEGWRGTEERRY